MCILLYFIYKENIRVSFISVDNGICMQIIYILYFTTLVFYLILEDLLAMDMKMDVFLVVSACSLVETYKHFGEIYCLRLLP